MPIPDWMYGCKGKSGGIGAYAANRPSLTGIHRFDRLSGKKVDKGKTQCAVCGSRPPHPHEQDAWEYLMAAEEETERIRTQERIMKSVAKGYSI